MSSIEQHAIGARRWVTVKDFSSHLVLNDRRIPVAVQTCTMTYERKKLDVSLRFSCSPAGLKVLAEKMGTCAPLSFSLALPPQKKSTRKQDTAIQGTFRLCFLEVFAFEALTLQATFQAVEAPPRRGKA